jgi:hypothetical protein
VLERSRSDGYEASMGDSGDENGEQCQQPSQEWNDANLMSSSISATEKVATWEESLEDDLMPRGSLGTRSLGSKGSRSSKAESSGGKKHTFWFSMYSHRLMCLRLRVIEIVKSRSLSVTILMPWILQVDPELKPTF